MIPVLYYDSEPTFTNNGICFLDDCTRCIVTEERNGLFELEFDYPISGKYFNQITIGRAVKATPAEDRDDQIFFIYRRTAPISGIVTFNCFHISYFLSNMITGPFTASTCSAALQGFRNNCLVWPNHGGVEIDFTFDTDKTTTGTFTLDVPASVKSMLCGQQGSILDVYGGGEYEFNNDVVTLHQNRGSDNGVTIRYGKNLVNLVDTLDGSNLYDGVVPFWKSETDSIYASVVSKADVVPWKDESNHQIQDENLVDINFRDGLGRVVPLDLTDKFQTKPTAAQLRSAANAFLTNNTPWIPKRNIKVDFVALWQTEEYKGIAPLERVKLCDTVHVVYDELGVVATAKVIKTVWNVLLDKYDDIELGDTIDEYVGFTGNVLIGDRRFKVVNGLLTNIV